MTSEQDRILAEYQRRARELPEDFYALTRKSELFFYQGRTRAALALLRRHGQLPMRDQHILEIGCGSGLWLGDFARWGIARGQLAGIELAPERAQIAKNTLCAQRDAEGQILIPGADIRIGDAAALPWADQSFDIVLQSTVFTSILDVGLRQTIAREMLRVLKPNGLILWYDFQFNNPRNPHVRGVTVREVAKLFPLMQLDSRRITLAPPIARRLVPISWPAARCLEMLRFLNTHLLIALRSPI